MSYKYTNNYHQSSIGKFTAISIVIVGFLAGKFISGLSVTQKIGLLITIIFIGFIIGIIYVYKKIVEEDKVDTHHYGNSLDLHGNTIYNKGIGQNTLSFITKTITIDDKFAQIQKLREVHPKYFEDFISEIFVLDGYTIEQKSGYKKWYGKRHAQSDGGIDLIVSKNGIKKYIQIKKNLNQEVGVHIIRDFYGAITDKVNKDTDEGLVITTALFSQDAKIFASEKKIRLIDYNLLLTKIERLWSKNEANGKKLFDMLHFGDNEKFTCYARTCKRCYAPLVNRKRLGIYGCMNYPYTGCKYSEG